MNTIYANGYDVHVKKYVVYGKPSNNCLYLDQEFKVTASETEINPAFDKGLLIVSVNGRMYIPVANNTNDNIIVTIDDSSVSVPPISPTPAATCVGWSYSMSI